MSRTRAYFAAFVWLFATLTLSACSEAPSQPLRVGINPWPGYAPLFLAADQGFFMDEGVEVELIELASLADVRRAFERGQVDGMTSSLVEVLDADRNSDRHPVISLMTDYSNGADVVLAIEEISGVNDLKGRRVGVEPSSLNRFILARALGQGGLSMADVEVVNLPQLGMREAVVEGAIDAVVTYPPMSVDIMRTGKAQRIFSSADIPGEVVDIVSFGREVIQQRSADIDAFERAWGRAVRYIEENPDDAYAVIGRNIGMTVGEVRESYDGVLIIPAERQEEFLNAEGPLAESILAMTDILWPDQAGDDQGAVERFFRQSSSTPWSEGE